jgi:SET domain-containing protein
MTDLQLAVPAEVADSAIAGKGVFAAARIPQGGVVVRFATSLTSVAEFGLINHSCDPNLGWTDDRTLVATRDIDARTELTTDYALAIDTPNTLLRCHCETYRCRQIIEGDDWQIPQLQHRYAGYWAPHIVNRIAASLA